MSRPPTLESLRKRIALLQDERDELTAQTRSRAEIGALLDGHLLKWSTDGAGAIMREFRHAAAGHAFEPLVVRGPVVHLGPLFTAMLGAESVKAALMATLEQIPAGLANAERLARIREICTSLDDLELSEEKMVMEAGVERRPDVRPEIVLGC